MSADDLKLPFDPDSEERDALELQHGLELDEPSTSRPAEGARQATPGEVLFEGFSGSEDAGDFLGLDTELHFSNDVGANGHVDTGLAGGDGLDLQAAPGTATAPAAEFEDGGYGAEGEAYDDGSEYAADGYPAREYADEYDGGEYEEELESSDAEGGPHKGVLLVSALFAGALAVAGAVYGPGLLERFSGGPAGTEVATTGSSSPTTGATGSTGAIPSTEGTSTAGGPGAEGRPGEGQGAVEPTEGTEDPFFASVDGVRTAPVKTGERGSLGRLFSSPVFELVPRESDAAGAGGLGSVAGAGGASTIGSAGRGSERPPSRSIEVPPEAAIAFPGVGTDTEASVDAEYLVSGLGWAGQDDVDVVWRRAAIPLEAMDAPTRVATPRVGTVRVHLAGGDFFEGKLIALGEGHVWIQTAPGRMAFPGDEVEEIEPLGLTLAATDPGAVNAPARGERIRVRAPGGMIYGRVVSRDESGALTLRTDEGGKIMLTQAEVEAVGNARAVIVDR